MHTRSIFESKHSFLELFDQINAYGQFSIGALNFPSGSITFQLESGFVDYIPQIQYFNQSGSSFLYITNNAPAVLNFTVANFYYTV